MNTKEFNFKGTKMSGFLALLIYLLIIAGSILVLYFLTLSLAMFITILVVAFLVMLVMPFGLMTNEPNNARVMVFFGKYKGTFKNNGFFWVNPFYNKKKITQRARNLDAEPIKVNDKTGNPIMIGMVLVWKVVDTYKAVFEIDTSSLRTAATQHVQIGMGELMKTFENFVKVQGDAALREVAGQYAYDDNEIAHEEVTLRSGGEKVNAHLEKELNERLQMAGIEVIEARINYLAYAPEIAAIMLRRQQASAIISARSKIVEGAVSMVQMALELLDKENVVEMDEEKKAAMVSNLLVVLCADEAAQPVINTGTLHQ